jgi:hypothetical protein
VVVIGILVVVAKLLVEGHSAGTVDPGFGLVMPTVDGIFVVEGMFGTVEGGKFCDSNSTVCVPANGGEVGKVERGQFSRTVGNVPPN